MREKLRNRNERSIKLGCVDFSVAKLPILVFALTFFASPESSKALLDASSSSSSGAVVVQNVPGSDVNSCFLRSDSGNPIVDKAIVFATDVSGSASNNDFIATQRNALAAGLRDELVRSAIRDSSQNGERIAVAYMEWSDSLDDSEVLKSDPKLSLHCGFYCPELIISWIYVTKDRLFCLDHFANLIESLYGNETGPKVDDHVDERNPYSKYQVNFGSFSGRGTRLGQAMFRAISLFEAGEENKLFRPLKKIIDVSSDGRSSGGISPHFARNLALEKDITINALLYNRQLEGRISEAPLFFHEDLSGEIISSGRMPSLENYYMLYVLTKYGPIPPSLASELSNTGGTGELPLQVYDPESFSISVSSNSYSEYARAIKRKILIEMAATR